MRVLILSAAPCVYDARPRFTARQLASLGHDVVLLCRAAQSAPEREFIGEARVLRKDFDDAKPARRAPSLGAGARLAARCCAGLRDGLRRIGSPGLARVFALSAEFWTIAAHADTFVDAEWKGEADIVHAVGLAALPSSGRIAARTGAALIYDAVELERDRNALYLRPFHWLRLRLENYWIKRANGVATVSEEIASQLRRDYVGVTAETIQNIGPVAATRPGIRKAAGVQESALLAVYIGAAAKGRGLAPAIAALGHAKDIHLAVVGPLSDVFRSRFSEAMRAAGAEHRCHPVPPQPPTAAPGFAADADVSVSVLEPTCASYDFALPNKLFQATQAGLPLVVGRTPALRRVVRAYRLGEAVDEQDAEALAAAIRRQAGRRHTAEYRAARAGFLANHGPEMVLAQWTRLSARARCDAGHTGEGPMSRLARRLPAGG